MAEVMIAKFHAGIQPRLKYADARIDFTLLNVQLVFVYKTDRLDPMLLQSFNKARVFFWISVIDSPSLTKGKSSKVMAIWRTGTGFCASAGIGIALAIRKAIHAIHHENVQRA